MRVVFHYTSIIALELILETKKIEFSALSQVSDNLKVVAEDFKILRKYFFVSCLTSDQNESIPFWHSDATGMKGVRIAFELPIFNVYTIFDEPKNFFQNKIVSMRNIPIFQIENNLLK